MNDLRQPTVPPMPPGQDNFPVVGIGASAGGLDACTRLVDHIPPAPGMAFILVQHLDPSHASMMADLLAGHTAMNVRQAVDGMRVERDHFYVIPPGKYLAVVAGALQLSKPAAAHGARLPFDFLLHSLAIEFGARAIAVVLSGTGADGSLGLKAVKEHGGRVIAQEPTEAGFDGMPRSAIATGLVDRVLPAADMPAAFLAPAGPQGAPAAPPVQDDSLREIIELLREKTAHDFTLYKNGTLRRRIERRMAMAETGTAGMAGYLITLRKDARELDLLAKDLLINITSFFRDPKVFEHLAGEIIPELVKSHALDQPLRLWVAGCSTGEETYSLAILLQEAVAASKSNIKLQLFASDVDSEAVASARAGIYPESIAAEVSAERLARFFIHEDQHYRIQPELRAMVVFTLQDVLADPPFSRLDFISCRNLLIYLGAEAQARVIAAFHFALREGGLLLLGGSETIAHPEGRFETVAKTQRLYRRIGHNRPGEFGVAAPAVELRAPARAAPTRLSALAELCRQSVLDAYSPAAILINKRHECLFFTGPTDRYLRVASGHPSQDLLAMAPPGIRIKLRAAIQQAGETKGRVSIAAETLDREGAPAALRIEVTPLVGKHEDLLLVCLIDAPAPARSPPGAGVDDAPRVAELERELAVTRAELQGAIRNLELSGEEQKAINEEALSVNEEFQSTNEELLTSKEELQSLNEELTALNSQLQETLERQRTASNDLQNILYSTDVATLFLDRSLKIRFFTPATKSLFSVIPGDVGRPLADLQSLAADGELPADAKNVLKSLKPIEREVEGQDGKWFIRRILPYRAHGDAVEGIVITFTDITERKRIRQAMERAQLEAEQANLAKSRFLAAASHDLRQPLQMLALLQGLLAKKVESGKARELVARLDETLASMSGMLNTLLDINQIDSGIIQPAIAPFAIGDLLTRLREGFAYQASAQGLELRVVDCNLSIETDPLLLEQMLRNLLSNALKYTKTGKVLLGCRRDGSILRLEVWDTGIGIAAKELHAIFEEYHQVDNAARERSRGLGLGLSIVQRLAGLLGHKVSVRSNAGKGSMFSVEVARSAARAALPEPAAPRKDAPSRAGNIFVIEDDPQLRELLESVLTGALHSVHAFKDGQEAVRFPALETVKPDLILADYNLPGGMDGLETVAALRARLRRSVPAMILTGDIATQTLRDIAAQGCIHVSKPVKSVAMLDMIQAALTVGKAPDKAPEAPQRPLVYIVDDDPQILAAMGAVLTAADRLVAAFVSGEAFLSAYRPGPDACLLVDARMPGISGVELLQRLRAMGAHLPAIMITGASDVAMAVEAMKAGASDFIEKPVGATELVAMVARILDEARDHGKLESWRSLAASRIAGLTGRQREIMDLVLAGEPSKNIAADLGISQRTVETHRAAIMRKTGANSLPALARLALAAAPT